MQHRGQPLLAACTLASILAALAGAAQRAEARGTPAGTDIVTQATVTYALEGEARSGASNQAVVRVDEVVDFAVVWQDAGPVEAFAGAAGQVLAFRLQNTGNGSDRYLLAALAALAGDDFDPGAVHVYLDSDGDGLLDPVADAPYVRGANDPVLGPDQDAVVFLTADIPGDAADGATGALKLVVTSGTGVGAPGTVVIGAGDDGTNAILGAGGGVAEQGGTYEVIAVTLSLVKNAVVADPDGGTDPRPGAVITYTIVASVAGAGTARGVVVTDPLPVHTAYRPASLRLNGRPLTDTDDGDQGDVGATTPGTMTVRLGDLTADSAPQEVAFQVTIQ